MIILLLFGFLLLVSWMLIKDKLSLVFLQLYLIWWGLLLFVSTLNPYGLYPVSTKVYAILILSIFCFSFGFITNRYIRTRYSDEGPVLTQQVLLDKFDKLSKSKLYLFALISFSLFISRYLLQYQKIIILYGTEEARNMRFFVGAVFSNSAEIFFYNFFIESFSILVTIYLAFSLVWLRFNKAFYLSILFIYIYSSFGAGRGIIIELGFYISFLFIVKNKMIGSANSIDSVMELKKLKSQRLKVILVILPILLCLYLFSIYLSNYRSGVFEFTLDAFIEGNNEFMSQIVVYCVGSFRALEYGINNIAKEIGYTYGSLSFGGIDEILGVTLNVLGIKYEYSNVIYGIKTSTNFQIGFDQSFNALYTNVFTQYLDFGLAGVIVFSFFWGLVFNKVIVFFQRTQTIYSLFIVSFLFVAAIMTALSWKLQAPSSWIFLGALYLLRNK